MHALKKRKHYLSKVPAYTDNVALRYWKNAQNLSPREVWWLVYIGMFDLDIAHIPGVTRCYQHGRGRPFLIGVPRPLLPCLPSLSATLGPGKTFDLVARLSTFPNMKLLVAEFVRVCPTCQHVKPQHLPLPTRKWQSICMGWVLGLNKVTRNGKTFNAVLTVTHRATRLVQFIPTCKIECAEDTADLMFWNSFRLHGLQRSINSDRDPCLTSAWWHCFAPNPTFVTWPPPRTSPRPMAVFNVGHPLLPIWKPLTTLSSSRRGNWKAAYHMMQGLR